MRQEDLESPYACPGRCWLRYRRSPIPCLVAGHGRADLAEARFNRQVIAEEAQARLEAQSNDALIQFLGGDPDRLIDFRLIDTLAEANVI